MAKDEQHGFDLISTGRRLEDWFLEHFAFPAGAGMPHWPGGRSDVIRVLLLEHWCAYVVRSRVDRGDRPARRLPEVALRALGVALARLEISGHEVGSVERKEVAWLRQAGAVTSISPALRAKLLALADQIATSPISRSVTNRGTGRPKVLLANAVAQQLRAGGLSYGKIAMLMDATEGATRWRCNAPDARSLAMHV